MFICEKCLDNYEGPGIEWAKASGPFGMSFGKCEMCEKSPRECKDVPSSGNWWPKKKRSASE